MGDYYGILLSYFCSIHAHYKIKSIIRLLKLTRKNDDNINLMMLIIQ